MDIVNTLKLHKLWLAGNPQGVKANLYGADLREADLREADLREADLREADLRKADLREADLYRADLREADLRNADLREADLREANLDYTSWSLSCRSLTPIVDDKIARQLLYHALAVALPVLPANLFPQALLNEVNKFHRVGEVPKLTLPLKPPVDI